MGNLVLKNCPERITEISKTIVGPSDHQLISFTVISRGSPPPPHPKSYNRSLNYSKANWVELDCFFMDIFY